MKNTIESDRGYYAPRKFMSPNYTKNTNYPGISTAKIKSDYDKMLEYNNKTNSENKFSNLSTLGSVNNLNKNSTPERSSYTRTNLTTPNKQQKVKTSITPRVTKFNSIIKEDLKNKAVNIQNKIPKITKNNYNLTKNNILRQYIPKPKLNTNKQSPLQTQNNSFLYDLMKKDDEKKKFRNEKIKKLERKSEELSKKKTFSSDHAKKEKIKKELDDIKMKKEMENCTFKPKIHRNVRSAFNSGNNSPCYTGYNSRNSSVSNSSTYDRLTSWKNKIKTRYFNYYIYYI
jgi:hypothetical protein